MVLFLSQIEALLSLKKTFWTANKVKDSAKGGGWLAYFGTFYRDTLRH